MDYNVDVTTLLTDNENIAKTVVVWVDNKMNTMGLVIDTTVRPWSLPSGRAQ